VAANPYGYWTYNGRRNGLKGGPSSLVELPDGRYVIQKYEGNPALLEDEFILYAISHSRQARADFCRFFPDLDPVSQERLTDLILRNPRASALVLSDQEFADALQHENVTSGVRTRLTPALTS
jgi:hypothetical protein